MVDFEPSAEFVSRTMESIRSYEKERGDGKDRLDAFLFSKRVRIALAVGGVLLAMLNLIRIASTLIAPALCF
ncbi:MAG TPA: hypothetical protein VMG30_20950 [Acidobacteriota bacterium]|nr:hypothetical protein [Acidobacteriota bacterium]